MNESETFSFDGCATCRCVTAALTNPDAVPLYAPMEIPVLLTLPSNLLLGDG